MTLGAEGTIGVGMTTQGHVLVTIKVEDGTEIEMALTFSNWITLTEKVKQAWLTYYEKLDIIRQDQLKKEARDALP